MLRKAMLLAVIGSAMVASSAYAGNHVKVFSGGGGHYPAVHQLGVVVRAAPHQASTSAVIPRAKLSVRKSGSGNHPDY